MPVLANTAEVVVKQRLYGQDVLNVWHVQVSASPDEAELLDVAAHFQLGYGDLFTHLSDEIALTEIFVRNLGVVGGIEATLSITPEQVGGISTESMPSGVALCISLRTALGGRRFRGRKYFAGIPRSEVVANSFTSAFVGALLGSIGGMIGDLATAGNPISIASFTGSTLVPVTAAVAADLDVDSQRRRLNGRGT